MSSKNFYGLTGDVTIDGGILNVANTNVSGNVTSTSLFVSNVATLGTTKTFVVTVDNSKYVIDGVSQASLELHEGQTYIFDLSSGTLSGHPFVFDTSNSNDGTTNSDPYYTTGITSTGTYASDEQRTFVVPAGAPTTLYYYCTAHSGMGGQINISPAAELVVSGRIVASGNVEASKITASANVEVTGNVVASKFVGDGSLLTNVTGATTSGLQVVTDNSPTTTNTIQFTNPTTSLTASSNIVATGNVTADHFIGDGSRLSGIVTSLTLEEVVNTDNTTSNTVQFTNTSTSLTASGNVEVAGNVVVSGNVEAAYFVGDGSKLSGIVTSVTLEDAVNAANTTSNTVQFTNTSTSLTASGNVEVSGNVVATYFVGDGSRLTGISGGSGGTSHWTKDAVTNQLHYNAGSVGISNTNPAHDLSVGSNLYIDDDATDGVLMVTGNVHGTYFVGDGSRLINLPEGGGSTNWTTSGNPVNKIYYPQNPGTTSVSVGIMNAAPAHTLSVGSNLFVDDAGSNVLVVDGNITAESMFLGALGIKPAYPLDSVTDTGNVTPHTISFTNPTLGITTASNVEIGGALVVGKGTLGGSNLEVGEANLFVNTDLTRVGIATDQPAATLHVNGSLAVDGPLTFGTVDVAAQHGLEAITAVDNTTPLTIELQNADTSLVTTGNVEVGGNVITSKDLTVTGNVTTNSELIVAGNVFYTNLMSVSVKSNVVTEYTGPHDRPLRKYPEVLTSDVTPTSPVAATSPFTGWSQSWGGYTTIYSSRINITGDYDGIRVYDADFGPNNPWISGNNTYSQTDGSAAGGTSKDTFQTIHGSYITLNLPNKIRISHVCIYNRDSSTTRPPKDGIIWGSSDGGATFTQIHTFSNLDPTQGRKHTLHITSTSKYDIIVVQITAMSGFSSTRHSVAIGEIEYYGYEEGSGSLDTTLKSIYNVPATTGTQLEVYYDGRETSSYSGSGTTVTDISPNTNNGTLGTGVGFDATYKAFTFNGATTASISGTHGLGSGSIGAHSFSYWLKRTSQVDAYEYHAMIGTGGINSGQTAIGINQDKILIAHNGGTVTSEKNVITDNTWIHVAVNYNGGTTNLPENHNLYINGIEQSLIGSGSGGNFSLVGNELTLGRFADGGNGITGSIANFRLYSKVLNAEQVQELYDYQKDYFLGSKSQLTIYKGHLGVGVTEPSGQLELAGDERIQEYPPGPLTNYDTNIPGHGVFTVYASTDGATVASYAAWKAFNDVVDGLGWHDDGVPYTNGSYTGTQSLAGIKGEWIALKLPYAINLKSAATAPRSGGGYTTRGVGAGVILGSNDGNNWDQLHSFSGLTATDYTFTYINNITAPGYYTTFALLVTELAGSDVSLNISEIKFFGTPGPTTLDKGSLSLTRSLDVPRVSRYDVDTETPRPEKLVVDFDTTVNSSPADISGNGNHGTFSDASGKPEYSAADKAFKFVGVNGAIWSGPLSPAMTGDKICSMSAWFKTTNASASQQTIMWLGQYQVNNLLLVGLDNGTLRITIGSGCSLDVAGVIESNTWYHVVGIKQGTGSITSSNFSSVFKLYLNGEPMTGTFGGTVRTLSINTNYWYVGAGTSTGDEPFPGYISNPKLYNTILEPSEVRKLYNLGRTGRSMVIGDTAVGIGKTPEANLDVRGSLAVRGGNVMIGQADIQVRLATDPGYSTKIDGGSMFITNPSTNGGYEHFIMNNSTTGTHKTTYFSFRRGNGQIGSILTDTGAFINFNTGSDYRLKENIVPMSNVGLEVINKLQPKVFNFKNYPNQRVHGFIAHELQEHIPIAVSGEKDEMRGEEPMYQGVDASKIVPWLVKAIQELYEENQTLKTRLDALETSNVETQ